MKFEQEFRKAFPETVGETDREYDLSNYTEWLESLAEEKITSLNSGYAVARDLYKRYLNSDDYQYKKTFIEWCEKRLNA